MSTIAQQKFFASLAAFARASADVLDEMSKGEAPAATVAAEPAKPAKVKAAPAVKAAEPTAAPVATEPAKPATNGHAADTLTQCRSAAKSYAEVYGREGLKEVLKKYTEGTLADVPPAKLPELLKELS